MNAKNLEFLKNDPGAVRHGNFINYYKFNSVNSRLEHLDYKMFPDITAQTNPILVLDVGCNSGHLTSALLDYLQIRYPHNDIKILAIDIDHALISRACEAHQLLDSIEFQTGNIMDENGRNIVKEYLTRHERQKFDFTFCFSVTMWIHLNSGDEGLLDFLKYIKSISITLIIEPQLWKCYRTAQKRLKKAGSTFENYESLQIRSNVVSYIESTILQGGKFRKIYESNLTNWDRTVHCYSTCKDILNYPRIRIH